MREDQKVAGVWNDVDILGLNISPDSSEEEEVKEGKGKEALISQKKKHILKQIYTF